MGLNARRHIVNTRVGSNYRLPDATRRVKLSRYWFLVDIHQRGRTKMGPDVARHIVNARVGSVLVSRASSLIVRSCYGKLSMDLRCRL